MVLTLVVAPPVGYDFRIALVTEYARLVARDAALGVELRATEAMVEEVMGKTAELSVQLESVQAALRAYGIAYDAHGVVSRPPKSSTPPRIENNALPRPERRAGSPPPPLSARRPPTVVHCGVKMSEKVVGRWTEARIALIRRDYGTDRSTIRIYEECCALPGDKITSFAAWQAFVSSNMKLRRPPRPVPEVRGEAPSEAVDAPNLPLSETIEATSTLLSDISNPPVSPPSEVVDAGATPPSEVTSLAVEPQAPPIFLDPPQDQLVAEPTIRPRVSFSFIAPAPRAPPRAVPVPVPPPDLGVRGRLATALTLPPPLEEALEEPIPADAATIRATAELWGVIYRGEVDLWQVNQAAHHRGARPFSLLKEAVVEKKRRKCLRCPAQILSEGSHDRLCATCKTVTPVPQYSLR